MTSQTPNVPDSDQIRRAPKVLLHDPDDDEPRTVKARDLSGSSGLLFRRNSTTGAVEALPRKGQGIALNTALHAND